MYAFGAMLSFTIAHASVIAAAAQAVAIERASSASQPEPEDPRKSQLAAVRDLRRARDRARLARRRRPGPGDALRGLRLARGRLRLLPALPPAGSGPAAARDRAGAAPVRAGARARVPVDPRADRRRAGVARGGRRRGAPRDRARRPTIVAAARDRRPARAAARRRPAQPRWPRPTALLDDARAIATPTASAWSTASCAPATPGRAIVDEAERRVRPRSSSSAPRAAATGRSSARPSTTSSSTRRAASWSPPDGRPRDASGRHDRYADCSASSMMVGLGVADPRRSPLARGRRWGRDPPRRALHRRRRRTALPRSTEKLALMARKLPGLTPRARCARRSSRSPTARSRRRSTSRSASSPLHALGFTPLVLLGVGVLFLVVSLSYAEGDLGPSRDRRRGDLRPPRLERSRRASSPAGRSSSTT